MVVVLNGHGFLDNGTLKSAVSQEWIDELSQCFACWYKFREAKSYFNNCWIGMVKNGCGILVNGALKSGIFWEWLDDLRWFFFMLIVMK